MQILEIIDFLTFFLPLFWLAGVLIYWLKYKEVKIWWIKYGISVIFTIFIVRGLYTTVTTYNLWSLHPISKYLLPPYDATYFFSYSFYHYWLPNLVNIAVSIVWAGILFSLYKYSKGRFLDKEEIWLGFFTALMVGWPKFVIYLVFAFGILLIQQIFNNLILKDKNPIPLIHSLIVSALIIAIFGKFFISYLGLEVLLF